MNDPLQRLAENINLLTRPQTSAIQFTRAPGSGADGIHRRNPEAGTHRVRQPALLLQLVAALPPGAAAGDGTGRRKPGSRPPVASPASDAFNRINAEAMVLRDHLRYAARKPHHRRHSITGNLAEIRALAHALGPMYVEVAARKTGEWVQRARVALLHDPPLATLRDVVCRYCQGPLSVPSDASGPVRCVTRTCRDEGGRRPVWPRETWHLLLVDQEQAEGAA